MQVLFDDGDKANAIPASFVISESAHEAIYGDESDTVVVSNDDDDIDGTNELGTDGGMVEF